MSPLTEAPFDDEVTKQHQRALAAEREVARLGAIVTRLFCERDAALSRYAEARDQVTARNGLAREMADVRDELETVKTELAKAKEAQGHEADERMHESLRADDAEAKVREVRMACEAAHG